MADIFLSYANDDVDRIKLLVSVLEEQGWSIWWDHKIRPGKSFDQVIEEEIDKAKCIVVLWSNNSVQSDWVKSEAEEGKQRHILAPALLDNVKIPLGFRRTEAAKLYGWTGDSDHPELKLLLLSIEEILKQESTSTSEIRGIPKVQPADIALPKNFAARHHRLSVLLQGRVAIILILSFISIAMITTILIWRSKTRNTTGAPDSEQVIVLPTDPFRTGMIAIPGGTFLMGRNDGPKTDGPAHSVTVNTFLMDRTEVANDEYASFVSEMNYPPPSHWVHRKPPPGQEQWPVSNVSFEDVNAFAVWRSKRDSVMYRLPTEEEWEYAARGGDQNLLYPWGNSWVSDPANVSNVSPTRVGSYPEGRNRWGILDLIGNVWEWTSTSAHLYPGVDIKEISEEQRMPFTTRGWVVVRGGCFASTKERNVNSALRDWFPAGFKHQTLGFRLVRAAK